MSIYIFPWISQRAETAYRRERDWVLGEFKSGRSPILIATDVASRGLGVYSLLRQALRQFCCGPSGVLLTGSLASACTYTSGASPPLIVVATGASFYSRF